MIQGVFWVEASEEDRLALLAVASDDIFREPEAQAFNDLMSRLYEGEMFWYLDAQDAYGVLEVRDAHHTVSLFNHERVLLTFAVDTGWLQQARDSGGFGLILTHQIPSEATRERSKEQLVKARDEGLLELISIGINALY